MVTSLPTKRFGRAAGMRAPCSIPRMNPAGAASRSSAADVWRITNPTAAAATRIARIRRRILRHFSAGASSFACVGAGLSITYDLSMFFSRRATQEEYFDAPERTCAEIAESYRSLARVNRMFAFAEPFQRQLPKYLGRNTCKSLSFLDLGAGDGSLGELLTKWAADNERWDWRFTNLDLNPAALSLKANRNNVAGSALALPFRDESFDVVIASQMTHHLTHGDDVVQHLREAWRVTRRAIFFTDLNRSFLLYCVLWVLLQVRRFPKHFRHDGLLSVRRGFRTGELRALAGRSGITGVHVEVYYGARLILRARKF
jgi:2-polyprenyl-3-methyl-5-hydroxy-6-metoxy-1,4-benzoquinol methylase